MKTIGLTGGIGSGKSVVARLLTLYGIPVYDADRESKRLTNTSPEIREPLIRLFDASLFTAEGLNRPLLASYIFNNEDNLRKVNSIIHPAVRADFLAWAQRQQASAAAIESAILFDSGFNTSVDITLLVDAPTETRINNAMRRDNQPREAIIARSNNQLPQETLRDRCDYVIYNAPGQALIPQVEAFLREIL